MVERQPGASRDHVLFHTPSALWASHSLLRLCVPLCSSSSWGTLRTWPSKPSSPGRSGGPPVCSIWTHSCYLYYVWYHFMEYLLFQNGRHIKPAIRKCCQGCSTLCWNGSEITSERGKKTKHNKTKQEDVQMPPAAPSRAYSGSGGMPRLQALSDQNVPIVSLSRIDSL